MASPKNLRLTQLSLLAALIVVLQLMSYALSGMIPFNLSLVLIPIVVGGVLLGVESGAVLGLVFGAVVLICCAAGWDKGGAVLWNASPMLTALVCLGKGAAAGAAGAAVAKLCRGCKRPVLGVFLSAVTVPVVNTGLFILSLLFLFRDTLVAWAAGADMVYYIFVGLVGVNFLVELALNVILAPVIERIVSAVRRVM